jgi:transportin-3
MDAGNLRIEDEEEIITAITHALCSVLDKELRKSSLARLLCSSYTAVEKLVCTLSLVQPWAFVETEEFHGWN